MKKTGLLLIMILMSLNAFAADEAAPPEQSAPPAAESVTDLAARLQTYLAENGVTLLLNILAAAAIFFLGRWAAKAVALLLYKAMSKGKMDGILSNFVKNLVYVVLLVFVCVAALNRLGVQTASFVAIIGAAGLAIGLALGGTLSNFASGVLLILFKPFNEGDYVEAGGAAGTVKEIHIFNTILNTPDNKRVIVPNAQVTGGNIINYSVNGTRRVDMVFGVSYGDDLKKAAQVIKGVLSADTRILADPAPVVAVLELADSSVNFVVRPWVKVADYWAVYFDLNEKIKLALEDNGLTIPFPQRDVHMIQS